MNTKRKVVALQNTVDAATAAVTRYEAALAAKKSIDAELAEAREALVPLLGRLPSEGTRRVELGGRKLVVRTRLNRRLNKDKVQRAVEALPEHVSARVLPVTRKLSLRELHWLEDNDNAAYKIVRGAFTVSRGAPSIEFDDA